MDKANRAYLDKIKSYKAFFNTKPGIQVLAHLKKIYWEPHCVGQTDKETYINLGQRNVVIGIMEILKKDPQEIEEQFFKLGGKEDEY